MLLFSANTVVSIAQNDTTTHAKNFNQFVSFQVNGLIHELINTNGTPSTVNLNPYLLNYHINNKKSGWGLRVGAGYCHTESGTIGISSSNASNSSIVNIRLGVEKAKKLSKKMTIGIGIDAIYRYSYSYSTNASYYYSYPYTQNDTAIQTSRIVSNNYGGGVMGWLRYRVTKKIFIGTESSFYYTVGNNDQTINNFTNNSNNANPKYAHKNDAQSNGTFTEPVVVYLLIKI